MHIEESVSNAQSTIDPIAILGKLDKRKPTIGMMLCDALHSVRTHLGMEVAFIAEFSEGARVFRYVDGRTEHVVLGIGDSDPLEESYCQRVVDGRLPELINDARRLPEALSLPVTMQVPVGAHLSVPIRFSDGAVYGTFCCFRTTADDSLNERDLNTLRLFAEFAGRLLENQAKSLQARQAKRGLIETVLAERAYGVVYQPIVNLVENRVVGHEALARFTGEPYRSPDKWFAEAAQVGLQQELEVALIEAALQHIDRLPLDGYLSLNVSPQTILAGSLGAVLQGQPLERLMLEVTEHASVPDYAQLADVLQPLRSRGLRLAVDDAGAGYASFRHILQLKPDVIKLDGSLIQAIDSDNDCRALAAALIRFAEETGSKIVAECVETPAQLAVLRRLQVNKAQGYLLGRPLPIDQLPG